jgi:hypothetical protein
LFFDSTRGQEGSARPEQGRFRRIDGGANLPTVGGNMRVNEAERRLGQLLLQNGFSFENPSPSRGWTVFKEFCREPVACGDDGILFQIGVYDFSGEALCHFHFVRQFSLDANDGEHDRMEQLHLLFTCKPTDELKKLETSLWAYNFADLDSYFVAVENLSEFRKAMSHSPWNCQLYQEQV